MMYMKLEIWEGVQEGIQIGKVYKVIYGLFYDDNNKPRQKDAGIWTPAKFQVSYYGKWEN